MSDQTETTPETASGDADPYRVLARKYRPSDFTSLIGQDAMVRTLTNAIEQGRLAHAFMLTGVRGVGKTTTARIIARTLNCIGADGQGGPTVEPCGVCEHCVAIAADRHVDVIEMDAASRTGVDDIREIIEGVRYKPTSARYKVYIIDEVHMLSKNAFNALLKTLEEPPEHVKFIFATTEIRKVPVTVLSRCQRFDLRRIDQDTLAKHFRTVVEGENASVSDEALHLIARAADGSVRDGLSLLDQAIAHTQGEVAVDAVRDMLGLADRALTFDLLDSILKGEVEVALGTLATQYESGADPAQVLEDMLELVHWLTRIKVTPAAADAAGVPEMERVKGKEMADGLTMAQLTRAWQMLLKGLSEVRSAPSALQAAEMILVRLMYGLELPSPADAIKALQSGQMPTPSPQPSGGGAPSASGASTSAQGSPAPQQPGPAPSAPQASANGAVQALAEQPLSMSELHLPDPLTFDEVVVLTQAQGEMIVHANLVNNVHLVHFEPGRIEFRPTEHAPRDLAQQLAKCLNDHTQRRWTISVSRDGGQPTLKQQADAEASAQKADAASDPLVRAILDTFPGAQVDSVVDIAIEAPVAPLPGDGDDDAQVPLADG